MSFKPSVFIVDEDDAMLRWCEQVLLSIGFTCDIFSSAFDYLQSDWKERATCLVLDSGCDSEESKAIENAVTDSERVEPASELHPVLSQDGDLPSGVSISTDGSASDFPVYQQASRGLGVLGKVLRSDGNIPVILLAEDHRGQFVREAFLAGAFDVLAKPLSEAEFQRSVGIAAARKNRRTQIEQGHPVDVDIRARLENLTPREFEVLGEMLRGMSIKQLAVRFEISIQTAAKHRSRVLYKMRSENEVQLIHLLGRRWQQVYADIVI